MSRLKKKIIVTSFASNVARMETVFHCAKQTGRNISLVGSRCIEFLKPLENVAI